MNRVVFAGMTICFVLSTFVAKTGSKGAVVVRRLHMEDALLVFMVVESGPRPRYGIQNCPPNVYLKRVYGNIKMPCRTLHKRKTLSVFGCF